MNLLRIVAVVGAVVLAAAVWLNVLRTVFVPRHDPPRLARWTLRLCSTALAAASRRVPGLLGERMLALVAPISVFALFAVWLVGLLVAFAFGAWGLGGTTLDPAGYARFVALRSGGASVAVALLLWLCTAVLVGVFMVLLVRIVDAYARRELLVARLAAQAAEPPDAERMIAAYVRSGSRDSLATLFVEWSAWLAEIRCTHTSYPALMYYRPTGDLSWLQAAVTMLDTAALVEAMAPSWGPPNTCGLIDTGTLCLKHLGSDLGIVLPRSVVSLHWREQHGFADTIRMARSAGLPVERSPQDVWQVFQDMRTRYAPYAAAIGSALHYQAAGLTPGMLSPSDGDRDDASAPPGRGL